ncbi:MAG TPA: type III secretion protein [Bacillaceae bacterium]|nr:type III secretion protein [Bacillaceae bacterium]
MDQWTAWVAGGLLASARLLPLFFFVPPFSFPAFPVQVRALFALGLAFFVAAPELPSDTTARLLEGGLAAFVLPFLRELAFGFLLALSLLFLFSLLQTAGNLLDFEMGLAIANVFDPQSGSSVSVLGHAVTLYAAALFFASGAYRTVIRGLFLTFDALPPGADFAPFGGVRHLVSVAGEALVGAILLTFPFLVLLFFIDLTSALLARAVPQLNLFVHGLPLKLLAGNFLLVPFAGVLAFAFFRIADRFVEEMLVLTRLAGG